MLVMKKIILFLLLFFSSYSSIYAQECVKRIVASRSAVTAFLLNDRKYSWGINEAGQVGNNTTTVQSTAIQTVMSDSWQDIAHGDFHTIALHNNGTIWAWGNNIYGQLGNTTIENELLPIQVGTDTDWIAISAGRFHSLALKADGTLWGWGNNNARELSSSEEPYYFSPYQLSTDTDWDIIKAGFGRTYAIKTDGTLWGRGRNTDGCLGQNPNFGSYLFEFTQIGSDTMWTKVSDGQKHTLALKSDSTLWALGNGLSLGLGSADNTFIPAQIGNDYWKDFSAGGLNSIGIKNDGTLWEWGVGYYLTGTSFPPSLSPVQKESDADWKSVGVGYMQFLAIKENHTLWTWGRNEGGYGNGTTEATNNTTLIIPCGPVSAASHDFEKTTFYPNPVKDFIEWKSNSEFAIYHIKNMLGQTIKTGNTIGNQLDLSELKAGMYLLVLETNNGKTVKLKFFKS